MIQVHCSDGGVVMLSGKSAIKVFCPHFRALDYWLAVDNWSLIKGEVSVMGIGEQQQNL